MPIHNVQYPISPQATPHEMLKVLGPLINVEVSVPSKIVAAMTQQSITIPNCHIGHALLDTGASATGVDESILKSLNLPPVGNVPVGTPGGTSYHLLYPVALKFPGTPIPPIEFNAVIGSKLQNQGVSVLIGRDILCHCMFVINGPMGHFSISF